MSFDIFFTPGDWTRALDHLRDNTLLPSDTAWTRTGRGGEFVDMVPPVAPWRHPWHTVSRWNDTAKKWQSQVNPGLVNGLDPLVPGVEPGPDNERGYVSLCDQPWMPLNAFRTVNGIGEPVPEFFKAMGVRVEKEEGLVVDEIGGVRTVDELEEENPLPPRSLVACNLYLAKARATFRAQVDVIDPSGASGVIVDYSATYDTTQLDAKGTRARLQHAAQFPAVRKPSLADRLSGDFADEGEDRASVVDVFLLSPPNSESAVPDGRWTPFHRHGLFWNLKHGSPNTVPQKAPAPIRFFSGLGLGLGDLLINQYLALDNDLSDRILTAVTNSAPEGRFSIS